ncbi:MAG: putative DNA base hypermodification protein [Verrucomicrobiales bacterium]|nr:putative DNA base hypermodification protein [Verrucomicrobiales bacterium]
MKPLREKIEQPSISPLVPTPAYDTYWKFAAERQNIFFKRLKGAAAPWTDDEILQSYRFTNTYRVSDRVSQYLISNVIQRADLPDTDFEVFFRIILFKTFNKIDTWEALERHFSRITTDIYCSEQFGEVLELERLAKRTIYSAAYIMPSPQGFGHKRKHLNHLALIEKMLNDELPSQISSASSLQEVYELLLGFPGIGKFLAFQYAIDINYSDITDFSEMDFVVAGPGAIRGIKKCFSDTAGLNDCEVIKFVAQRQEIEFQRLGLKFTKIGNRPLQLVDCQNLFCEVDKYSRVFHPEFNLGSGRERIKQKYKQDTSRISYSFPTSWNIDSLESEPDAQRELEFDIRVLPELGDGAKGYEKMRLNEREVPASDITLDEYQDRVAATDHFDDNDSVLIPLLGLAGEAGELLSYYKGMLRDGGTQETVKERFSEELGDLFWYLAHTCNKLNLSLADIASQNLSKTENRWGHVEKRVPFDEGFPETERLPRRFVVDCHNIHAPDGSQSLKLYYQGKPLGDELTDNSYETDGYRFHDAFHFAFAAVLGWSPLSRSLLGTKRKSDPKVDEVEDGGRAIVTEEGVSAMVFAHCKERNWVDQNGSLGSGLLRTIKSMTSHLEVSVCTMGEWENAIRQGFDVWRSIRAQGGGSLKMDLDERTIRVVGKQD